MSRGLVVIAVVVSLLVVAAGLSIAQNAKPSENPGAKVGDEIVGPDGGKMVWVPAGEFIMGSADGEGAPDEHPAHRVRISQGFWLEKCAVTNAQYRQYCRKAGVTFPRQSAQGDDHPVVQVSWNQAKAYCERYGLSLPTEAEWEYAARGPQGSKYPWGDEWDEGKCCNGINDGLGGRTFAAGSFPEGASWCGALDMAGNVWQWSEDWYSEKYYKVSPADDPRGPEEGDSLPGGGQCRVLRGGSWFDDAYRCRSTYRDGGYPSLRSLVDGFRCVAHPKTS